MIDLIEPLTQFGVAGLMGLLWVWERAMSRKRDGQLDEAHRRLMRDRQEIRALLSTVNRNTRAIERFEQTQNLLKQLLERIDDELRHSGRPDKRPAHECD